MGGNDIDEVELAGRVGYVEHALSTSINDVMKRCLEGTEILLVTDNKN